MLGILGFVLGIIYSSFLEWWVHKVLFHEFGKKKGNIFSYHLRDHHKTARKNGYVDNKRSIRETLGLLFLTIIHLPICLISVDFYLGTLVYVIAFYILHQYSHSYPEWTKRFLCIF